MKYIISENVLDKLIFRYLDNKNFVIIETDNDYYFLYNEDDESSVIKFIKNDNYLWVRFKLLTEIESFFSLEEKDAMDVIKKYVENTLNIQVLHASYADWYRIFEVKKP